MWSTPKWLNERPESLSSKVISVEGLSTGSIRSRTRHLGGWLTRGDDLPSTPFRIKGDTAFVKVTVVILIIRLGIGSKVVTGIERLSIGL